MLAHRRRQLGGRADVAVRALRKFDPLHVETGRDRRLDYGADLQLALPHRRLPYRLMKEGALPPHAARNFLV